MKSNPYETPSSSLQKTRVATLEESGYVSRVQWRWEIFHMCFAIIIGYVTFVLAYSFVVRVATDANDYLSEISELLNMICQLTLALTLAIPIALGAAYLAWKIARKWRQFALGYSVMLMVLIFMLFGHQVWSPIPLVLIALVLPTALATMFAIRRLRGFDTAVQIIDEAN